MRKVQNGYCQQSSLVITERATEPLGQGPVFAPQVVCATKFPFVPSDPVPPLALLLGSFYVMLI